MIRHETQLTQGFEDIKCFWDNSLQAHVAKIQPGQYYVSYGDQIIGTVLGSCVSACARDVTRSIGAMNHFMLPTSGDRSSKVDAPHRYGAYAMEHMLNDLFRRGVKKRNLEIKIVGGGSVMNASSRIGEKNIEFVQEYLENEGLPIAASDVGTSFARQVVYDVTSGRMRVKHMESMESIRKQEESYLTEVSRKEVEEPASDIELF